MKIARIGLLAFSSLLLQGADPVTFTETIAPILYQNCVTCHRPGEAAPFSLISFDDARRRGALLATVTQSRYMPPWHAAHGYGEFADERRLTDGQIAAIGDWVKQGMPQGDPAKMPKMPEFTDGWHLGKPDLILEMPKGFDLPASGPDVFRNFVIPLRLTEDKWIRAVEFRPSARKVVHHVLFAFVPAGSTARFDGADGKPGFGGMGTVGVRPGQADSGGLGGWAVGGTPRFVPESLAMPLPKGSDFMLQMHFHLTGKPEMEKSVVGIYFADKAPERKMMQAGMPAVFGFGAGIDIPAGQKDFTIQDTFTLPVDVKVYSALAHAHYLAKEMKATATLPDGSTKPLIWVQDWDFNWQEGYTYKEPFLLPKGTRVNTTLRYDNSAENPRNPSNPPRRMLWGEESFDEMGTVGLTVVAVRKEDEAALQRALVQRAAAAIQKGVADGTAKRFLEHQQRSGAPVQVAPAPRAQQITVFDRQGRSLSTVGEPGIYGQPALSPDGTRVAVIRNVSGTSDVWVFNIATGKGTQITADAAPNDAPVWSPDGRQIAYVAREGNVSAIYRKTSDGTGTEELLYKHTPGSGLILTDWSAQGMLCFWSGKITYGLLVNGDRKAKELFNEAYNVRGGRFSPDSRFFAYSADESGKSQMYAGGFDLATARAAKGAQVSTEPAAGGIFWREDSKELFFLSLPPDQAVMAVDVSTSAGLQTGPPRLLFKLPSPVGAPAQLSNISSRDGKRFVFLVQTGAQ